jgi:hypothetical protein
LIKACDVLPLDVGLLFDDRSLPPKLQNSVGFICDEKGNKIIHMKKKAPSWYLAFSVCPCRHLMSLRGPFASQERPAV